MPSQNDSSVHLSEEYKRKHGRSLVSYGVASGVTLPLRQYPVAYCGKEPHGQGNTVNGALLGLPWKPATMAG